MQVDFERSCYRIDQFPKDGLPELAFVGRSNVGKSSLLNAMVRRHGLAKTSKTPGKTRAVISFLVDRRWRLMDLPGYGFARGSKRELAQWDELMGGYLARPELKRVLLLIDIRHTLQENDRKMQLWLEEMGLNYTVILTKADKLSRGAVSDHKKRIMTAMGLNKHDMIVTSSSKKQGISDLQKKLSTWVFVEKE